MMLHLGGGGDLHAAADAYRDAAATAQLTELRGMPNGLRRERFEVELPADAFPAARERILGLRWFPERMVRTALASDGRTALHRSRPTPLLSVDAPVRIAERVDQPHRAAVAIVTLRGHPARGVERYEVVLDPALGRATLLVEKAWTIADPLARLMGPISRRLQERATRASLRLFAGGEESVASAGRWRGIGAQRRRRSG